MTFPIPKNALDDRLAIVGTAGSGKTYLTMGAIEHLLSRKSRVIAIDPLGVMFGLRLCTDGKTASPFQPVIFGGSHGDLPVNEHAGALIGEAVATSRESCIIDLSLIGTKAGERRFMLAFLTALYRSTDKEPVHLVIDEADMFAPQKLLDKDGEAAKLLGMMETIVRRGRVKGFIPWLITQRPAVLSKDVLSQADGLVALKLTAKQDRDAIGGWIEGQADAAEGRAILASLPSKQRGEGVLWIPARGILAHVTFPPKATYDSSRTPGRGEKRHAAELKPLDLGALKDRLATVEAEAKANDPRALKAEVAKLKSELAKAPKGTILANKDDTDRAHGLGALEGRADGYRLGFGVGMERALRAAQEMTRMPMAAMLTAASKMDAACKKLELDLQKAEPPPMPKGAIQAAPVSVSTPKVQYAPAVIAPSIRLPKPPSQVNQIPKSNGHDGLTTPQRRVLASIGFWRSVGTDRPSRAQVAGVAGYSPNSGGFNNLIGGLNTAGLIAIPMPGHIELAEGAPFDPLDSDEARAKVLSVLSGPQRKIVEAALSFNGAVGRDLIAERTEYSANSGGFNNLIGSLCTLTILTKPAAGHVALSDWAREVLS